MNFILSIVVSFIFFSASAQSNFYTQVGDPTPEFTFETIDNKEMSISDFKGKTVLLSFFGTKCPPCLSELPQIQKQLVDELDSEKFVVLAISTMDNKTKVSEFSKKKNYDFIYASDAEKKIFKQFAHSSLPRTVVIDAEGIIRYQAKGYYINPFKKMVKLIKDEVASL